MKIKGWHRGEKCDVPISDNEIEILERYEAEVERGLMHNTTWIRRMEQLERLREKTRENDPSPLGTRWDR